MASAVDIVGRVSRVVAQLRANDDPDAVWLAEGLAVWLAGAPLDGALGLHGGWRDVIQHQRQQEALAVLLSGLPSMSARASAAAVATLLNRYETTAWKSDRETGRRPAGAAGCLWDYLTAGGPTSTERLRKQLAWVTETRAVTHRAA